MVFVEREILRNEPAGVGRPTDGERAGGEDDATEALLRGSHHDIERTLAVVVVDLERLSTSRPGYRAHVDHRVRVGHQLGDTIGVAEIGFDEWGWGRIEGTHVCSDDVVTTIEEELDNTLAESAGCTCDENHEDPINGIR
jgi:hypothetical protein